MFTWSKVGTFVVALVGGMAGNWLTSGALAQPVPLPGRNQQSMSVQSVEIVDENGVARARLDTKGLVIMDQNDPNQVYMTLNTAGLTLARSRGRSDVAYLSEDGLRVTRSTVENNLYTSLDESFVNAGSVRTSRLNMDDRSRVDEMRLRPTEMEIGSRLVFERRRVPGMQNASEAARRGEVTMLRLGKMGDGKEVGTRATRLDRGLTLYHASGKPYYRVGVVDNLVNNTGYSFAEFLDGNATSRMALGWSITNKAAIYFYDEKGKPVENLGGK